MERFVTVNLDRLENKYFVIKSCSVMRDTRKYCFKPGRSLRCGPRFGGEPWLYAVQTLSENKEAIANSLHAFEYST